MGCAHVAPVRAVPPGMGAMPIGSSTSIATFTIPLCARGRVRSVAQENQATSPYL